ncbi:MAG: EamA family transporter [Sporolactobacillus sp.]
MTIKDFLVLNILGALWGASFLFMRLASPVLGPFLLIDLRVLLAGVALLLSVLAARQIPDYRHTWRQYFLLGALNAAVPFTLIASSELHLSASVSSILNATTPLFTALVARVWLKETLSTKKIISLLLGIGGVVVLAGWGQLGTSPVIWLSILFSLLAAVSYGFGGVYAKRAFASEPFLTVTIGQQLAAGMLLLPFSLPSAGRLMRLSIGMSCAVLALALICTAIAYILYFYLNRQVGPTKTSSVTLLVSVYGVIWGMLFLHEMASFGELFGMIIILSSVSLITEVKFRPLKAKADEHPLEKRQ